MPHSSKNRQIGPRLRTWPFVEFIIVLGLCLLVLFVVIPNGTNDSNNFGLSPRMVPNLTATAIGILAIVTLLFDLIRLRDGHHEERPSTKGLWGVVLLVLATFLGTIAISWFGMIIGGAILFFLATLAVGERRPSALFGLGLLAVLLLLLVEWSGL